MIETLYSKWILGFWLGGTVSFLAATLYGLFQRRLEVYPVVALVFFAAMLMSNLRGHKAHNQDTAADND